MTRPPEVVIELPEPSMAGKSPVHFKVKFVPHNGASIDVSSLRVLYLKDPVVDLTSRVKPFLVKDQGIDMPVAEIPPAST